ncbi:MAG: prepilin-type N-terminal cleavage/methylation domain-containing protein [Hyphomicrobiales bacterium]|nr:prepilin-type N-terminal cleavage/methylation domain-containing protein [Hyphomicrobiales bacterium]MCC2103100.1 prepilin-type N-terminal cleavage/methylation domain-containing protein [Hyphomicrobiales bacterium]MCC2106351.1 prepilin-type N-terminal cleavage/methylation domain-containing protein [Hyphomicrobiales bacterium]MCO5088069.1 prepilin-type N-terminal cleavage/methylation domain-containing protein [Methylobacteriaceae bacterium]HRY03041.1 prepilin-type N-terminal cleavage/methylati
MRRNRNGFSTLELLLSLAIVALIVAGVAGGLRIGRQVWRADRINDSRGEIEAAARALSLLLERCVSASAARGGQGPALVFSGQPQDLAFVYMSEGANQWGGQILARLGIDPEAPGKLTLWTGVFRPQTVWSTGAQDLQKSDVLDGVTRFEVDYFGADPGQPPTWRADWMGRERLPKLVRIRIERQRDGRSLSVEFIANLRLA